MSDTKSAFECAGGRESRRLNLRGLQGILLPIVVRRDDGPLVIVQFKNRIGQGASYAEGGEGGTDRTNEDIGGLITGDNEAANHDTVARLHERTRGNIYNLGRGGLAVDIENLNQRHTARRIYAVHNRGVTSRGAQRFGQRTFLWIAWLQSRSLNLRSLVGIILPIIVERDLSSVVVVQFKGRIGQRARHAQGRKRRSERANDQVRIPRTLHYESADQGIRIRFGFRPCRKIGCDTGRFRRCAQNGRDRALRIDQSKTIGESESAPN